MPFRNRVTEMLGVEIPIVQAPMGWIARSPLASAVSNAGALGIIETSSGELDAVKAEIRKMRDLTDKPFGVNIAQAFVRDPAIIDFVVGQGVKFVTTSAGSPTKYTKPLKEAGLTVFHVVPTSARARSRRSTPGSTGSWSRAARAAASRTRATSPAWCCCLSSRPRCRFPSSRPAACWTGPPWRQPSRSAPRASRWEPAWSRRSNRRCTRTGSRPWSAAAETDTIFLNRQHGPGLRALRTKRTEELEHATHNVMAEFGDRANVLKLYFGGDLEAAVALSGQVAGRIDSVRPVGEVIRETADECLALLERLAERYPRAG